MKNSEITNTEHDKKETQNNKLFEAVKGELFISVQEFSPSPLTIRESEIVDLVKSIPNDMDLGKAIRRYCNQYLKQE